MKQLGEHLNIYAVKSDPSTQLRFRPRTCGTPLVLAEAGLLSTPLDAEVLRGMRSSCVSGEAGELPERRSISPR